MRKTVVVMALCALTACGGGGGGSDDTQSSGNQANTSTDDHGCNPDVDINIGDVAEVEQAAHDAGVEVDDDELDSDEEPESIPEFDFGGGISQQTPTTPGGKDAGPIFVNVCGGTNVIDQSTEDNDSVTNADRIIAAIAAGRVTYLQFYRRS